jgi:hypothetical protein
LQNLDNLINLAYKQAVDIDAYEELLATYLFKMGEQQAKIRELCELNAMVNKIVEL